MDTGLRETLRSAAERGVPISRAAALAMLETRADDLPELLCAASAMRRRYFGSRKTLCSIMNARGGACKEDCAFCAQSAHHETGAAVFGLKSSEQIRAAYRRAQALPVSHFGVVTSGAALGQREVDRVCSAVRGVPADRAAWCASLGCLGEDALLRLKAAGVRRFHHNLETAESFFPAICSTHGYERRLATVRAAKAAGLEVCCGGILGMGESLAQRVELAFAIAAEQVESVPLNFLVPVKATALAHCPSIRPLPMLRTIAMFRMVNPRAELKVCVGRMHLGDLQALIFYAGATGMMIGDLLTIAGRDVARDMKMLRDLGGDAE